MGARQPDGGITLDEFSRSSSRCHRCRPMLQFPGANLDHFTNMTEDLSSIAPVTEASCTNACHPQLCGTFRGAGTCRRRKSHRMRLRLLLGRLRKALTTSKCKTHGGRHGHATNFRPTHGSQKLSVKSQLFHLRTGGSRASVFFIVLLRHQPQCLPITHPNFAAKRYLRRFQYRRLQPE